MCIIEESIKFEWHVVSAKVLRVAFVGCFTVPWMLVRWGCTWTVLFHQPFGWHPIYTNEAQGENGAWSSVYSLKLIKVVFCCLLLFLSFSISISHTLIFLCLLIAAQENIQLCDATGRGPPSILYREAGESPWRLMEIANHHKYHSEPSHLSHLAHDSRWVTEIYSQSSRTEVCVRCCWRHYLGNLYIDIVTTELNNRGSTLLRGSYCEEV